jgi:DNA (cytosine-5)-methyltransferase 1
LVRGCSKRGEVLPAFPQPTHDFPVPDALKIKVSNGRDIQPIHTLRGTAPCHFVTIDDAIGDLPLFDWFVSFRLFAPVANLGNRKGTKKVPLPGQEIGVLKRTGDVPVLSCDRSKGRCGFEGEVAYRSEPMTTFQVWCRRKKTKDLQHITRTLKEDTVNR